MRGNGNDRFVFNGLQGRGCGRPVSERADLGVFSIPRPGILPMTYFRNRAPKAPLPISRAPQAPNKVLRTLPPGSRGNQLARAVLRLHRAGHSADRIARLLGRTRPWVTSHLDRLKADKSDGAPPTKNPAKTRPPIVPLPSPPKRISALGVARAALGKRLSENRDGIRIDGRPASIRDLVLIARRYSVLVSYPGLRPHRRSFHSGPSRTSGSGPRQNPKRRPF